MFMTTSMSAQELAHRIEELVENFIAAGCLAATEAVERAFASAKPQSGRTRRTAPARPTRRRISPRRSPDEVAELSERLYEAICAHPGEGMNFIAPVVGARSSALHVPAARLKRARRIRSVGQRSLTRYFPMVKNVAKPG
jgi:hypothetical protein